jgi:hypothetical protein
LIRESCLTDFSGTIFRNKKRWWADD